MIEILRTEDGTIKAVCEYYIVDEKGNFKVNGEYAWVNECEIAPQFRGNGILKTFAKIIIEKNEQVQFGYFWREKKYSEKEYPLRKHIRIYHKSRWLKLLGGNTNGWR